MIEYVTTYYDDGDLKTINCPWDLMPIEGVLWVKVFKGRYSHILLGADGYWIRGTRFGTTYEDAVRLYGGDPFAAYEWSATAMSPIPIGKMPPPADAHVIKGIQIPHHEWEELSKYAK